MQKKFFIFLLILIFFICNPVYSFDKQLLNKIENNIYGFDYSNDTDENRVKRLEKTVYGKNSTGNINNRLKKISDDISADVIGLEIQPVRDTFLAEDNAVEESNVEYPIVNEIEEKIFGQTYKNRDFHTRIVTIEKKLFGKIYDVDDYSKRMDRIKAKVMPEALVNKNRDNDYNIGSYYDNNINIDDLSNFGKNGFSMPFGQRNYTRPYTNYGDFSGIDDAIAQNRDNLSDNLTEIEYDTFGTEFSDEDPQTRIKRLNSVNKARKSSRKYDSQKFAQHMSTAMEIGAMILMILAMVL